MSWPDGKKCSSEPSIRNTKDTQVYGYGTMDINSQFVTFKSQKCKIVKMFEFLFIPKLIELRVEYYSLDKLSILVHSTTPQF